MPDDLVGITRRELVKAGAVALAAPTTLFGTDTRPSEPSMFNLPDLFFKVVKWTPPTAEKKFHEKALEMLDNQEKYPSLAKSRNDRWYALHTGGYRVGGTERAVDLGPGRQYLLDRSVDKVIDLNQGDRELAGFPSDDYAASGTLRLLDNGMFVYHVEWPRKPKELQDWFHTTGKDKEYLKKENELKERWRKTRRRAFIIADPQGQRKFIMGSKQGFDHEWPYWYEFLNEYFGLSEDGKVAGITTPKGDLYIFNLDTQKILYRDSNRHIRAINDNGSFSVLQNICWAGACSRLDIQNSRRDPECDWLPRYERFERIAISPNGNFIVYDCTDGIGVWSKNPRGDHIIESGVFGDRFYCIENDGTVRTVSGTYKFKDGKYHWAREGKPLEGLTIKDKNPLSRIRP